MTAFGLFGAGVASAETYVVKGGEESLKGTEEFVAAVAKANANPGANKIILGSGGYLPAKALTLSNTSGQLTIEGPAGTPTTNTLPASISGGAQTEIAEIFQIDPGVSALFKNVEISGQAGEGLSAILMDPSNAATKVPGAILTIENSELEGNVGPAVSMQPGASLTLRNSTVAEGRAEGVNITEAKASIFNSTIYNNHGVGINNIGGEVNLTNTIVAENKGGDCSGPAISDHSLDSDGSCGVELSSINPELTPAPVTIGGSTAVHAVKPGSPVIGAGDPATCLPTDQRGAPRPGISGDACDIGADEYNNAVPVLKLPAKTVTKIAEDSTGAFVNYEVSAEGLEDAVDNLKCTPETASKFPIGETTVKCTAIDGHGNKTSGEFKVDVESSTPLAPVVTTTPATEITSTAATLNGTVNPNGHEVTFCMIEYGTSTAYTASVPCSPAPGAGTSPVLVAAAITALSPGTPYDFRVVATTTGGTVDGLNETFVTAAQTTTTTTTSASPTTTTTTQSPTTTTTTESPSTTTTTSTSTTTTTQEPSTTTTTESPTTTTESPSTTTTTQSPTTTTTTESPSTTTTTESPTTTTTTESPTTTTTETTTTTTQAPVAAAVTTTPATEITSTAATLNGTVNPNGYEVTSCMIEYGTSTAYTTSVPCSPAPGSGTSPVNVAASITGLSPGTPYDFRVVATNAGGTVDGLNETFVTAAQTTTTTTTTESPTTTTTESTTTTTESPSTTTTTESPSTTTTTESPSTTTTTESPSTTTSTSTTTTTQEPSTTTTTESPTTTTTTTESPTTTSASTSTTTTTTESPTTTTTTESPTTTTETTTTTTTTTREPTVSALELLEALQHGVEGTPVPRHLRLELAHLIYEARVALQEPRPWCFPFPSLWQALQQWRADTYLHVFVAVIQQDQHSRRPEIPPGLANAGIQIAMSIEAMLQHHPGHIDFP